MWGEVVDVGNLRGDVIAEQRERLRLTKAETARRMFAYLSAQGAGARNGITLTGGGFGWATENSCRRAIDDLEGGSSRRLSSDWPSRGNRRSIAITAQGALRV